MKKTKKERVEAVLNELMESDSFTIDDLLETTVEELAGRTELNDIGKITISSVLSEYKAKYEDDFFNEIDEELLTEVGETIPLSTIGPKTSDGLSKEEVAYLRKMIQEKVDQQNAELIELKLALKNAGIDYTMILKDYRAQKEIELKEWEGNSGY